MRKKEGGGHNDSPPFFCCLRVLNRSSQLPYMIPAVYPPAPALKNISKAFNRVIMMVLVFIRITTENHAKE